jgi:hypothetical protein
MSAVVSRCLRYGRYNTNASTYEIYDNGDEPEIWGHVQRKGFLHWDWEITAGPRGEVLAFGSKRTKGGAWDAAICASQRPGILREVR